MLRRGRERLAPGRAEIAAGAHVAKPGSDATLWTIAFLDDDRVFVIVSLDITFVRRLRNSA